MQSELEHPGRCVVRDQLFSRRHQCLRNTATSEGLLPDALRALVAGSPAAARGVGRAAGTAQTWGTATAAAASRRPGSPCRSLRPSLRLSRTADRLSRVGQRRLTGCCCAASTSRRVPWQWQIGYVAAIVLRGPRPAPAYAVGFGNAATRHGGHKRHGGVDQGAVQPDHGGVCCRAGGVLQRSVAPSSLCNPVMQVRGKRKLRAPCGGPCAGAADPRSRL